MLNQVVRVSVPDPMSDQRIEYSDAAKRNGVAHEEYDSEKVNFNKQRSGGVMADIDRLIRRTAVHQGVTEQPGRDGYR